MMDDYYSKIQMMLIKKNNECGQLKFLSSKTTEEDSHNILDVCNRVENIFQDCGIPIGDDVSINNTKCIEAFKYLILNTNFKSQEQLVEDILNGYLVDMCPPISPYLLMEILFNLKYENILAESILYFPLDLVIEIMEIVNRCITMIEFNRASNLIINLIMNSYKKFINIHRMGTQSLDLNTSLDSFSMHIEELIAALTDNKLTRSENNLTEMKKNERFGLTLRNILKMIKDCLQYNENNVTVNADLEKFYKVTFGRNFIVTCEMEVIKSQLNILNSALLFLLMKILKKIDVNIYLSWASIDIENNSSSISLQQAIGFDCYYMLEFFKECKSIEVYDDLTECLQQLSSKPKSPSSANFEELYKSIDEGKQESLKELMNRYENWDNLTFEYVRKNYSMLDKNDFSILLEYLTLLTAKPGEEEHKQNVYNTLTKVLTKLSIPDIYEVVIEYILKHDASDQLESMHTEEMFKNFIHRNSNLKSSTNLRIVLFFILKNPQKFLMILIKMSIGCSEWKNVMIPPKDLSLLSPIMIIYEKNNNKLVLNVLKMIGLNTSDWETKKFSNFITTMIDENIFTADEFMNSVLIPMIGTNNIPTSSITFAINIIRQTMIKCTDKINLEALLINLARTMSSLRRSTRIPKYTSDELITTTIRIFKSFLHFNEDWLKKDESRIIIDKIVKILQPIDQIHFTMLWYLKASPNIIDIMDDYRRRIQSVILRLSDVQSSPLELESLQQDFQRHLILNSTEQEFIRVASEMTVIHWRYFQVNSIDTDENDALHKFIKMTIEIGCYCLELPDRVAPNTFGFLIKCLIKFIREIIKLENKWNYSKLIDCLRENIKLINTSIKNSEYENFYTEILIFIENCSSNKSTHELLINILKYFDDFGGKCVEIIQITSLNKNNLDIIKHEVAQDFINDCLMFEGENQSSIMRRVNEIIFNINDDEDAN